MKFKMYVDIQKSKIIIFPEMLFCYDSMISDSYVKEIFIYVSIIWNNKECLTPNGSPRVYKQWCHF
jgi:hypothetical protein